MQKNKYTNIIIVILIVIVLGVLFAWPRMKDPYKTEKAAWKAAGVECLINGHVNLAQHFHPHLKILIDGVEESVPANIGIVRTCMAEIHTHDANGEIHVESFKGEKEFNFSQFLSVWGKNLEREGYSMKLTLDGAEVTDPKSLILKDGEEIIITYGPLATSD